MFALHVLQDILLNICLLSQFNMGKRSGTRTSGKSRRSGKSGRSGRTHLPQKMGGPARPKQHSGKETRGMRQRKPKMPLYLDPERHVPLRRCPQKTHWLDVRAMNRKLLLQNEGPVAVAVENPVPTLTDYDPWQCAGVGLVPDVEVGGRVDVQWADVTFQCTKTGGNELEWNNIVLTDEPGQSSTAEEPVTFDDLVSSNLLPEPE